jgi:phosphoglycolate phosphatase
MLNYQYLLFDLDGTLTDSAPGVTNSVMYALKKYAIAVSDRNQLLKFVGPPLWESFEKYYGFSKEEAKTAVEYYRGYYKNQGIYENALYPGIEDLLKTLISGGKTLIIATSKPQVFAQQILEYFDIAKYFTFIAGSNLDGALVKKDEVILHALQNCSIVDKSRVIMIGDRHHDIIGAKKVGIHSMGVLYGYGDRRELEEAGAEYIVETVSDIGKTLSINLH